MAVQDESMAGKTCLVTGATAGIGKVTAAALARRGATVVLIGRNPEKCERTARQIGEDTGRANVEFLVGDLSSQADVRRLARQFQERHRRLDVLVNNAGAFFPERRESLDGIEMTWALNHLAYFLLTSLLLETVRASAPARIINVSSDAHKNVTIDFDDLQGKQRYGGFRAYSQSKLANLLFTYELAGRLEGTGVTVNALHPGFVATSIFDGPGLFAWFVRRVASAIALRPEAGARTTIYLATSPEVSQVTGQYFVKERAVPSSRASRDQEAARRLWQVSEELTGLGGMR